MKVVPLKAARRTAIGRNQVVQLRKQGWMPAVVYGEGGETVAIAISEWELDQHVKSHHKVFALDIEGGKETAFLQQVAWHALNDRPLHADFKRIDLSKPIESTLEVTLIGHPVGLGKGGVLIKDHLTVQIRCLPAAMPEAVEHDISTLELHDSLLAAQLALPAAVELLSPHDLVICHVAKAAGVTAAATAAPAAEGGEAPPAEPAS